MSSDPQFVIARPRIHAGSRLFCFPHAGGGPVAFFDWADRLGADIECVAFQYAGRGNRLRENPHTQVSELVEEIGKRISQEEKPFTLYGHSFGGIVAFELARWLRRHSYSSPFQLFIGASRAPHLKFPYPPIHHLPEKDFIAAVQTRYGGIPEAILRSQEMLDIFLPAMRADFTAYETYIYQPDEPLHVPIVAFAGADDPAVSLASMQEWRIHTRASFDLRILPGGHFFPAVSGQDLASALQIHIGAPKNGKNPTRAE
jgi:medium-chain acyl-[acyl-carrier-protein] hydrolase